MGNRRVLELGCVWLMGWLSMALGGVVVEPIQPLDPPSSLDPEIVALGERLFHDLRLSADDTVSCAHCHKLAAGGSDNMPVSVGVRGQMGNINAPSVYNLNTHISYFWDGRSPSLEALIESPLRNPVEMATDWPEVIRKLSRDDAMVEAFDRLFPGQGINKQSISRVLADFMRSLVTLNSPMDRWLKGDHTALTPQQQRGYDLFKSYGCVACHQGRAVGGNMYASMGVMGNYFRDREGAMSKADRGRFNVTGDMEDMHVFKVPSLRMSAWTAPYFHDGSAATLEDAIRTMGRYQLGREIPDADVRDIKSFLTALAGRHPLLESDR